MATLVSAYGREAPGFPLIARQAGLLSFPLLGLN